MGEPSYSGFSFAAGLGRSLVYPLFMLLCLSLAGCAATAPPSRMIAQGEDQFVRLEVTAEASRKERSHPALIGQEDLAQRLRKIKAHPRPIAPRGPVDYVARPTPSAQLRAFSNDTVGFLSEHISRALAKATSLETVMFFLTLPRDETIWEITSGAVYVEDDSLHVLLANYRHATLDRVGEDETRANPLTVLGQPGYEIDPGPSGKIKPPSGVASFFIEFPQHLVYAYQPVLDSRGQATDSESPLPTETRSGKASAADKLRDLQRMRDEGLISDEEFQKMREKLLREF